MLKETSIKYQAAGKKDILVQNYQFSGGEYSMFLGMLPRRNSIFLRQMMMYFHKPSQRNVQMCFFHQNSHQDSRFRTTLAIQSRTRAWNDFGHLSSAWHLISRYGNLVRGYDRTSFSRRQILACLDRYIAHWKGEAATDPEHAPIYNFETEVQTIKLDGVVSIVRFTDEEKTRIMNALGPLEKVRSTYGTTLALHTLRELRSIDGSCGEDEKREIRVHARKALQCAVTSLRLLKPESVGTMGFIRCPDLAGVWGLDLDRSRISICLGTGGRGFAIDMYLIAEPCASSGALQNSECKSV